MHFVVLIEMFAFVFVQQIGTKKPRLDIDEFWSVALLKRRCGFYNAQSADEIMDRLSPTVVVVTVE